MIRTKIILGILFFFFCFEHSNAQNLDSCLNNITMLIKEINSEINHNNNLNITDKQTKYNIPEDFKSNIENWKYNYTKSHTSNTGLKFSLNYDHKFGIDFNDDTSDDFEGYKNKLQATFSWNILKSGFINKKYIRKKADLLGSQYHIKYENQIKKANIEDNEDILNSAYNYVLQRKIDIKTALYNLQKELFNEKKVTAISPIEIKYELLILKGQFKQTKSNITELIDVNAYINSQTQYNENDLDSIIEKSYALNKLKIEEQILSNELQNISYWKEIEVRPYAKYYTYDNTNDINNTNSRLRNVANLGIAISLPINPNTKFQKREIKSKERLSSNETKRVRDLLKKELSETINELNHSLLALNTLEEAEIYYKEKIAFYEKSYQNNSVSIQEYANIYTKMLDNILSKYDLILKRENIKLKLLQLTDK